MLADQQDEPSESLDPDSINLLLNPTAPDPDWYDQGLNQSVSIEDVKRGLEHVATAETQLSRRTQPIDFRISYPIASHPGHTRTMRFSFERLPNPFILGTLPEIISRLSMNWMLGQLAGACRRVVNARWPGSTAISTPGRIAVGANGWRVDVIPVQPRFIAYRSLIAIADMVAREAALMYMGSFRVNIYITRYQGLLPLGPEHLIGSVEVTQAADAAVQLSALSQTRPGQLPSAFAPRDEL